MKETKHICIYPWCNNTFTPYVKTQIYCTSSECKKIANRERAKKKRESERAAKKQIVCARPGCGNLFTPFGSKKHCHTEECMLTIRRLEGQRSYHKNKEKRKESVRSYREKNKALYKKTNHAYYLKNSEDIKARVNKWIEENPEKRYDTVTKYQESHKEQILAQKKIYRDAHKKEGKEYQQSHRTEINTATRKRTRAARLAADHFNDLGMMLALSNSKLSPLTKDTA